MLLSCHISYEGSDKAPERPMLVAVLFAVPSAPAQLLRQVDAQLFNGGPTSGPG